MYLNGPLVNSSRDSQCYRSTANLSSTLSPAFEEQGEFENRLFLSQINILLLVELLLNRYMSHR